MEAPAERQERRQRCAWASDDGGTVAPCSTCEWGSLCPGYDSKEDDENK